MIRIVIFILSLMCSGALWASENILQVFDGKNFQAIDWDDIDHIGYSDGALEITRNNGKINKIDFSDGLVMPIGYTIPLIEINTEELLTEIPDKINYKKGNFQLSGFGEYEDVEKEVNIRGRGNSSWGFDKKPYRLKFDKKVSLCGLPSAKNYVLLANYTDGSLLHNSLAFFIGQLLSLPYTNSCVPVDVKLNGIYKGSYILTNKPGINSGSVDIDEENSIMWELDLAMDEDYTFKSPLLDLPVMVSDPDLTQEQFEEWKADFIGMEKAAVARKASDLVDMDIFARYMLVYEIMENHEIGWPKSVKLYKTKGGKYKFGPIWDFDNSMGQVWMGESYSYEKIEESVWKNKLFGYLTLDAEYKEAIKRYWKLLRISLPAFIDFIDENADKIRQSAHRNEILWSGNDDLDTSIEKMKDWLEARFVALDKIIK